MQDNNLHGIVEVPFGIWTEATERATGLAVPGQGASRFYRFDRTVELDALRIPVTQPGPRGGGPRHIVVTVYHADLMSGHVAFDGEVAPAGDDRLCTIPFGGVRAQAANVLCDERYPVDVDFSVLHPAPYTLPFSLLAGVQWRGCDVEGPRFEPPWEPHLKMGTIEPRALTGQQVEVNGFEVQFTSPYLAIGFSLKRPMLTFLGWDALGRREYGNCLFTAHRKHHIYGGEPWGNLPGGNGPYLSSLHWDSEPFAWTGTVEVQGNVVKYTDLHVLPEVRISAEFEVGRREVVLRLTQDVAREGAWLDAAAWGFAWDGRAVPSLATNAPPRRGQRRNGGVDLPGGWSVSGLGVLNCSVLRADASVELQTDTTGFSGRLSVAGIQLGARHLPNGALVLPAGTHAAELRLDVRLIEPARRRDAGPLPLGLRRAWGSLFAFRPEAGGFSNNGFSINCQNCLYIQADLVPYTANRKDGVDLVSLLRYTCDLAVQGGPGYACQWEQALDTAPSLAISIARAHQCREDTDWLRRMWPFLRRPWLHMLEHIDESGLYVSRFRSGNSGERRWSCNAIDTICFGHHDAYSNALAYRALRGGVSVARAAGDTELAARCGAAAARLRTTYAPTLTNPETGLIAGWRSADGALHDYAFTYINGMAICYGLVDNVQARSILTRLEEMRRELGIEDFHYGLPVNLKPVQRCDYLANALGAPDRDDGRDTFGMFINGALMPTCGYFYLRALSISGFRETADRICADLLESFTRRRFEGGRDSGTEYFSFEGAPTGYEGTLAHGYHILLAIAQHRGDVDTLDPEWWPSE